MRDDINTLQSRFARQPRHCTTTTLSHVDSGDLAASPKQREAEGLLGRLHAGDFELFYELTQLLLPNVYGFVRSMLRDESDAEDAVQETFATALHKIRQLRDVRCLRPWVMQIAVNEVRMKWRASRRRKFVSIDHPAEPDAWPLLLPILRDNRNTPFEAAARDELHDILDRGLQHLSPRCREVFWLCDVEQLSRIETAAILNISPACAKSRLFRARLQLRTYLAPILGIKQEQNNRRARSRSPRAPRFHAGTAEVGATAEDVTKKQERTA